LSTIKVERNEDFVEDGKLDAAKLAKYGLAEGKAAYTFTVRRKSPDNPKETVAETLLVGAKDTTAEARMEARRAAFVIAESASSPAGFGLGLLAAEAARAKNDKDAGASYFAKRPTTMPSFASTAKT